mmetsp:Transcript_20043/g.29075  ORF Transcript_20043/g.29075 Transcript_20043/m.29075 type:complete len:139 (+) Transcript_20043:1291-1707(+)
MTGRFFGYAVIQFLQQLMTIGVSHHRCVIFIFPNMIWKASRVWVSFRKLLLLFMHGLQHFPPCLCRHVKCYDLFCSKSCREGVPLRLSSSRECGGVMQNVPSCETHLLLGMKEISFFFCDNLFSSKMSVEPLFESCWE